MPKSKPRKESRNNKMKHATPLRRFTNRRVDYVSIMNGLKSLLQVLLLVLNLLKHLMH
jgi:hypothetical protein